MKVQDDDHDDFERQGGPQTTSSKIKDLFEFEVNSQYDGGEEDAPAADGDGF
jgi:solute carrier family 44 (choline transporter-like protein), member 2/4/5